MLTGIDFTSSGKKSKEETEKAEVEMEALKKITGEPLRSPTVTHTHTHTHGFVNN